MEVGALIVGGPRDDGEMTDKGHPARQDRENSALHGSAGESKGAVVITGNGMQDGYEPPSGALSPPPPADPAPAAPAGDGD